MIATCLTKYNGKWYRAGENLPDSPVPEKPVEVVSEVVSVETPKEAPKKSYTKKDISFMKGDDLRALAAELGIEGDHGFKELKQLVIKELGL